PHRRQEQALFGLARHDGRTGSAALENPLAGVEQQTTFDFFRPLTVALVAVVHQDGPDSGLEELRIALGELRRIGARSSKPYAPCSTEATNPEENRHQDPTLHAITPCTTLP